MLYKTNYEIGQTVFPVASSDLRRIVKCFPCSNTGKIEIHGESYVCPKCCGSSSHAAYSGQKWYCESPSIVGRVTVEEYGPNHYDGASLKVTYMIESTGVGTGRVWDQDRLFPSHEEARAHCDLQNSLLPKDECDGGEPMIDPFGRVTQKGKDHPQ